MIESTQVIDGIKIDFRLGPIKEGQSIKISSSSPHLEPLCVCLTSCWGRGPLKLLQSLLRREGIGIEGVTGFFYSDDLSLITAYYFDDEAIVTEAFFIKVALALLKFETPLSLKKYHIEHRSECAELEKKLAQRI